MLRQLFASSWLWVLWKPCWQHLRIHNANIVDECGTSHDFQYVVNVPGCDLRRGQQEHRSLCSRLEHGFQGCGQVLVRKVGIAQLDLRTQGLAVEYQLEDRPDVIVLVD